MSQCRSPLGTSNSFCMAGRAMLTPVMNTLSMSCAPHVHRRTRAPRQEAMVPTSGYAWLVPSSFCIAAVVAEMLGLLELAAVPGVDSGGLPRSSMVKTFLLPLFAFGSRDRSSWPMAEAVRTKPCRDSSPMSPSRPEREAREALLRRLEMTGIRGDPSGGTTVEASSMAEVQGRSSWPRCP